MRNNKEIYLEESQGVFLGFLYASCGQPTRSRGSPTPPFPSPLLKSWQLPDLNTKSPVFCLVTFCLLFLSPEMRTKQEIEILRKGIILSSHPQTTPKRLRPLPSSSLFQPIWSQPDTLLFFKLPHTQKKRIAHLC